MSSLAARDVLINGIEKNLRPFVKKHLDDGVDPNLRNGNDPFGQGRQLLTFAAIHGHVQIMELLLHYGANVDGSDFHGRTALSWAAEHGQYGAVKVLLKHGANVNAEDAELTTPLSWLIHAGNDSRTILTCNDVKEKKQSKTLDEGSAATGRNLKKTRKYLVSQGAMEKLLHSPWPWFNSFYEIGCMKFKRATYWLMFW